LTWCFPYTIIDRMRELFRRHFDAARLAEEHPLDLPHPNKRLVRELCGGPLRGTIEVARFAEEALPSTLHWVDARPVAGTFDYLGGDDVWHVNFADPDLFFGYGCALLAQDELQCAEHPALGSIREAMGEAQALTEEHGRPTPVTVKGVERRCEIRGLYGNAFGAASPATVRAAVRVIDPPTISNILAIAAPNGGRGEYTRETIELALITAYTGFLATGARVLCTGFWGCGAFGGNRILMTLVQLLAAQLAGIPQLRFYVADESGHAQYQAGVAALADVTTDRDISAILDRITAKRFRWGVGNGT
jgi:hypothetical protein